MLTLFKAMGVVALVTLAVADYRGWSLFSGSSANAQKFSGTGSSSTYRGPSGSSSPIRHK
jgi:hypothetical protein